MSSLPPNPPNTVGISFDVGRELRNLYSQIQAITLQLQGQGYLTKAQADAIYAPPLPAIKKALEAGSTLQLNVTGLSGLLAQPQQGGAPLLPTAPVQGSPAAQDGAIYRTVTGGSSVLRFWNGATDPGVDTPISAAGIVTVRKNNTTTIGSEGTLDFIEGSGITLTMTNTAGEIRITPSVGVIALSSLPAPYASILTASAVIDFGITGPQSSSTENITVTGAVVNDLVILGTPIDAVEADSCYTAYVSAADVVSIRLNNYSTGNIDPSSGTFKVAVLHF